MLRDELVVVALVLVPSLPVSAHAGYGPAPARRLKDRLDPGGTGAVVLDGRDQCPRPTVEFTAAPNPAFVGEKGIDEDCNGRDCFVATTFR